MLESNKKRIVKLINYPFEDGVSVFLHKETDVQVDGTDGYRNQHGRD